MEVAAATESARRPALPRQRFRRPERSLAKVSGDRKRERFGDTLDWAIMVVFCSSAGLGLAGQNGVYEFEHVG